MLKIKKVSNKYSQAPITLLLDNQSHHLAKALVFFSFFQVGHLIEVIIGDGGIK